MNKYQKQPKPTLKIYKNSICLIILLISMFFCSAEKLDIYEWGTYKPHLIFNLCQKKINSINFGLIYNQNGTFRWEYQNTKDNLYVNYDIHNGKDVLQETVQDYSLDLTYKIKWLKWHQQFWSTKITLEKQSYNPQNILTTFLYFNLQSFHITPEEMGTNFYFIVSNKNPDNSDIIIKLFDNLIKAPVGEFIIQRSIECGKLEIVTEFYPRNVTWTVDYYLRSHISKNNTFYAFQNNSNATITKTTDSTTDKNDGETEEQKDQAKLQKLKSQIKQVQQNNNNSPKKYKKDENYISLNKQLQVLQKKIKFSKNKNQESRSDIIGAEDEESLEDEDDSEFQLLQDAKILKNLKDVQRLEELQNKKKASQEEKQKKRDYEKYKKNFPNIILLKLIDSTDKCQISVQYQQIQNGTKQIKLDDFDILFEKKADEFKTFVSNQYLSSPSNINNNNNQNSSYLDLVLHSVSNILGGLTFTYGVVPIINSINIKWPIPRQFFSTSPSRKVFPRGFLWDEGFHLLIVCRYDTVLCNQIQDSWVESMDTFGYIAREQARGQEVTSKIPPDFVFQDAFEANPPTLILSFLLLKQENKNKNFIQKHFSKLVKWYKWMQTTQIGDKNHDNLFSYNEPKQFRWRCKENRCDLGNYMGSGLDDYPRYNRGTISKQHLDIHCWMIFFSQSMLNLSQYIGNKQLEIKFQKDYSEYKNYLNVYLDKTDKLYKDLAYNLTDNNIQYIKHLGYITLFPLFFGAVDNNSPELEQMLDVLRDPEELWSKYGIRSLSKKDKFFGVGDNYWRGNIWLPINYLILRGLKLYYSDNQKAQLIYQELRSNLITNLNKEFQNKGYLFENYNSTDGEGQRGHPFCGWTAIVSLIIAELY